VTLSDRRVTDGRGECVDSSLNVIVRDRELGWVMVPGPHEAKVERLVRRRAAPSVVGLAD
jgi:hypothetical protein